MRASGLGLVLGLSEHLGRVPCSPMCALRLGLRLLRSFLQRRPIRQSHHVFDPGELVEEVELGRDTRSRDTLVC